MKWGIYDPVDGCWMGDEQGPRLFDDQAIARVASEMVDVMAGWPRRRCQEQPYPGGMATLKGEVEKKMSSEEALKGMEDGRFL